MIYEFLPDEAEDLQNLLIAASMKTQNEAGQMIPTDRLMHCILDELLESEFDFTLEKNRIIEFVDSHKIALYWLLFQSPVHLTSLANFWSVLNAETANIEMKRSHEIHLPKSD